MLKAMGAMPESAGGQMDRSPVRFGTFVLDRAAGELRKNGLPVRLQGQPMQLLILLVERAGEVVSREEMQQKLWTADTFVEFDAGLNTAIKKVRQALGDTAENPRFVETVPKVGYRFIAPVHAVVVEIPLAAPVVVAPEAAAVESKAGRRWWPVVVAAAIGLAGGIWLLVSNGKKVAQGEPTRFEIQLAQEHSLGSRYSRGIALSPNGRTLVYAAYQAGQWRMFRRGMNELEAHPIPGTEDAWNPAFTADGGRIGYVSGSELRTSDVDGGNVRTEVRLSPTMANGWAAAAWGENGDLFYSDAPEREGGHLPTVAVWVKQGETRRMLTGGLLGRGPEWHFVQQVLCGGRHVLFSGVRTPEDRDIALYSLDSGRWKVVVRGGTGGRYLPTGHLLYSVYTKGRKLHAAPFDLAAMEVTGTAVELPAVGHDSWRKPTLAVSETGTLVYRPEPAAEANQLTWVDLEGKQTAVAVPPGAYAVSDVSADGRQLLIAKQEPGDGLWYVWRYALGSGEWTRIPYGAQVRPQAIWSPDGASAILSTDLHGSTLPNMYQVGFDGSAPKRVWESRLGQQAGWWSRANNMLLYVEGTHPQKGSDIWVKPMNGSEPAREWLAGARFEVNPAFSPDGKWVAYAEEGQVFVRAFPDGERSWRIADSGTGPLWAPDGRTVYFRLKGGVRSVSFQAGAAPVIGQPRVVFEGDYAMPDSWSRGYSLSPDGKRFLMLKLEPNPLRERTLRVVLNWFAELRGGR
ncbi:MAG: winged helix-turn-helix domain-containing protein [Bryobacterales bacterium]|nr:winged helix-turn-helix domain-containing protein [Bryobacterales bacterium]